MEHHDSLIHHLMDTVRCSVCSATYAYENVTVLGHQDELWFLTVTSAIPSRVAISFAWTPSARSRRTWRCLLVSVVDPSPDPSGSAPLRSSWSTIGSAPGSLTETVETETRRRPSSVRMTMRWQGTGQPLRARRAPEQPGWQITAPRSSTASGSRP